MGKSALQFLNTYSYFIILTNFQFILNSNLRCVDMSKDKIEKTKTKAILATTLIAIIVGGTAFMFGWLAANDWFFSKSPQLTTPELDGTIDMREWARSSYYNIPFYLDVDNAIDTETNLSNVDGWNYLSVAEDEENYYFALDLCSDRTNNPDGEWVSIALANRMPELLNSKLGMYAIEDYGLEHLMYNVSSNEVFEEEITLFSTNEASGGIPFVPEYDSYEVVKGTMEGDYIDFWYSNDNKFITLKSEYCEIDPFNNESDIIAVDFAVNITEKFPKLNASELVSAITDLDIRLSISGNVSANNALNLPYAEVISFRVVEHGAMPVDYNDPTYLSNINNIVFQNDSFTSTNADCDHNTINLTNGMYYFSLYGWNNDNVTYPTEFEVYIDQLDIRIASNILNVGTTKGTSLFSGNYDVSYAFGSSEMCEIAHRMFEIRISKSEFPVLDDDMLYVNVAGYGTMAIADSNYWVYPLSEIGIGASPIIEFYDDTVDFLKFNMSIT